jgi:protoporphyrinogen oxidase
MSKLERTTIAVVGAGPAGLTAAFRLSANSVPVTVLEADPDEVGGLSRTGKYKGFRFDIGGHRFFSKSAEIEELWTELLPDDMLVRERSSRIYYRGQFFSYPLKPFEALVKLGVLESVRCVTSFAWAQVFPVRDPKTFQDWVSNRFGRRLFEVFFETYTEKVWGMKCTEISADWAAQRIKGLSLWSALLDALRPKPKDRSDVIKTLIEAFRYPRKGPGMLWDACTDKIRAQGGRVELGYRVVSCRREEKAEGPAWVVSAVGPDGQTAELEAEQVVVSAAIGDLIPGLVPPVSETARRAAAALRYRDFITVVLILEERNRFSDNWIYIHEPGVKVGRIQNYKSWSPEMVPDPNKACYGMEYFCFEGDGLWTSSDDELIELAAREVEQIGLAGAGEIVDACVVRQKKAYPVYDEGYATNVAVIREELETKYPGLHLVGRNGMHKYNNQDHAMMTALLTAENILAGESKFDVWCVNEDAEYHESGSAGDQSGFGLRAVPTAVPTDGPSNATGADSAGLES